MGGAGNFTCAEGHIGALCEACDISGVVWKNRYSDTGNYQCGPCSEVRWNITKLVMMNVFVLAAMYLIVRITIEDIQLQIMGKAIGAIAGVQEGYLRNEMGVFIKIFTSYFQITSVIATFRLETPPLFVDIVDSVGNPVKQMIYSQDCFLSEFQNTIPHIYFRFIWSLQTALILLLFFILVFALLTLLSR